VHDIQPAGGPVMMAAPTGDGGGAAAAVAEKTDFDVVLEGFGDKKIGVIKVVRRHQPGLKEAKDLVEASPPRSRKDSKATPKLKKELEKPENRFDQVGESGSGAQSGTLPWFPPAGRACRRPMLVLPPPHLVHCRDVGDCARAPCPSVLLGVIRIATAQRRLSLGATLGSGRVHRFSLTDSDPPTAKFWPSPGEAQDEAWRVLREIFRSRATRPLKAPPLLVPP
jgi:ribosomal protein L7/L12